MWLPCPRVVRADPAERGNMSDPDSPEQEPGLASKLRERSADLLPAVGLGVLLVLGVLSLALCYRADTRWPGCFSSDDLYCVEVAQDVLGRGYERANWHLPYAPQLFPEVPLLLPCVFLFKNVMLIFVAHGLLYFGLLTALLTVLFRRAGVGGREAFLLAGSGVLFLLAALLDPACRDWVRWVFIPGGHAGALLLGMLLWLLVALSLDRAARWWTLAGFILLGALGIVSDRLVIAQGLGPIWLTVFVLSALRVVPWRKTAEMTVIAGAAWGLALGLQFALSRCGVVWLPLSRIMDVTQIREALLQLLLDLPRYVRGQDVVVGVFLTSVPVMLVVGLSRAWRGRASGPDNAAVGALPGNRVAAMLCLAAGFSCLGNFGAVVLSGVARHPGTLRYLLAALVIPFLFMGLGVRLLPGRTGRSLGRIFLVLVPLYAVYQIALRPGAPDLGVSVLSQPYPEPAVTLDRLARAGKLGRGLASYWTARRAQYLSRSGVQLRTILPSGQPWLHLQNPNAYLTAGRGCLHAPRYNFLVVGPEHEHFALSRAEILRHYGAPREKVPAGDYEIWLYDGLIAQPFTLFLRSLLAQRCRQHLEFTGPHEPLRLATPERNFVNRRSCRRVELKPDGEVTVTFAAPVHGSLMDLGAQSEDHYEITFHSGAETLGTGYIPRAGFCQVSAPYATPGNQSRLVTVPPEVAQRGWTSATVRGAGGAGRFALSHFLIYDPPPGRVSARQMAPGGRWRFESEHQPGEGSVASDPLASGSQARTAPAGFTGALVRGPSVFLEPGRYRVEFHVKAGPGRGSGVIGEVQINTEQGKRVHARRPLLAEDLGDGYEKVSLELETDVDLTDCEFEVFAHGKTALSVDRVELL
jgi:hypothetical protein